jgi:membrane fusion protein, adhesin transport system
MKSPDDLIPSGADGPGAGLKAVTGMTSKLSLLRALAARLWVSDAQQALALSRDRRMLVVVLGLFACLLIWSALAPIDRIVRAQGRIIAASRAQVVQHLEGGIVSEILAKEGQKVSVGQTLMRLSSIDATSTLQQGQSRLEALRATRSRLQAEATGLSKVDFEGEVPQELQSMEQKAFQERLSRVRSEQAVLQQQVIQRQAELKEAQARSQSLSNELALARQQSILMDNLYKRGAASQIEQLEAQGRTERINTQYRDVVNAIPRMLSAQAETSARLKESLARFRAEARTELNQVNAEIARIEATVDADSDRVFRTEVRAPAAGYVNRLYFNTVGGVVRAGEPVLEITPSEGPLAVEARVRPDDRASLRTDLPARVMLGAYDYTIYGALDGQVTEVSADTVPDENGQRYYRLLVQTAPAQGALAGEVILPGMTANADVVVGQRSVLSYILSPLLRFTSRALREPR